MHKYIVITCSLLLFLVGCDVTRQEKQYCIDIVGSMSSMQTIYVTDLAETVKYIPMETNSNTFVKDDIEKTFPR